MSGAWGLALQILLPIPTIFLVLLSIPGLPRGARKALLDLCERVLAVTFLGSFKLGQFLLSVSAIVFATASYKCWELQPYNPQPGAQGLTPLKIEYLATKWRLERNFWLSAFCFTMWLILNRYYAVSLKLLRLEDDVRGTAVPPPATGPSSELDKALAGKTGGKQTADIEMTSVPSGSTAGDKKSK